MLLKGQRGFVLQIISEKIDQARSVCFSLVLPLGVIDEDNTKMGLTHLIEHICFRRAEDMEQKEIFHFCEQRGVDIYASTGKNYLKFSFTARSDVFDDIIHLFSKMFYGLTYLEDDLIAEKRVIVAEMAEHGQTNADIIVNNFWRNRNYAYRILGIEESLNQITLEDVLTYKKRLTSADGMVLLLGNFTEEQHEFIQETFSGNQVFPRKKESIQDERRNSVIGFVKDKFNEIDVHYTFHVKLSKTERKNEILSMELLESVLFFGGTAYIMESLRERLGYVYEIESKVMIIENEAVLWFSASTKVENVCEFVSEIERLLDEFVWNERNFSYITAFSCDNVEMLHDNLEDYAARWVDNYIAFGEVVSPQAKAEMIKNLSLEDLNNFYQKLLQEKRVYFFGNVKLRRKSALRKILQKN